MEEDGGRREKCKGENGERSARAKGIYMYMYHAMGFMLIVCAAFHNVHVY
jgi:hypothetical protein